MEVVEMLVFTRDPAESLVVVDPDSRQVTLEWRRHAEPADRANVVMSMAAAQKLGLKLIKGGDCVVYTPADADAE
jgi:hypothetical protein